MLSSLPFFKVGHKPLFSDTTLKKDSNTFVKPRNQFSFTQFSTSKIEAKLSTTPRLIPSLQRKSVTSPPSGDGDRQRLPTLPDVAEEPITITNDTQVEKTSDGITKENDEVPVSTTGLGDMHSFL